MFADFEPDRNSTELHEQLVVRVASAEDAHGIAEVHCERWNSDVVETQIQISLNLNHQKKGETFEVFVALIENEIVGFARLQVS